MSNKGKKVKVHYTGTLDDGTKFDSSRDRGNPIEFTCMAGQMIPGFDSAVKDMAQGDTKNVHIPAAEAYGERDEAMVQQVPVDQIPNGDQLPVGQTVYMMGPGGQPFPVFVKSIEDGYVHPTVGLETPGEGCDLDYVQGEGVNMEVNYAISNSLGFGGHNASLLVKRFCE